MDLWGREDEEERTRRLFGIHAGAAEEKHFASHEELAAAIHTCTACHLRQEGNLGPVLSSGPVPAPLMLVGEGPGGVEDDWGAPLIGPSGQLLDKALASVGITRDRVYVTNVVKCRPRGNRTPDIAEGRARRDPPRAAESRRRPGESGAPLVPRPGRQHRPPPRPLARMGRHPRHAHLPSRLPPPPVRPRPGRIEMAGLLRPERSERKSRLRRAGLGLEDRSPAGPYGPLRGRKRKKTSEIKSRRGAAFFHAARRGSGEMCGETEKSGGTCHKRRKNFTAHKIYWTHMTQMTGEVRKS